MIDDIRNRIAPNQFGCLKGTSTAFCLLDMMHTWLSYPDSPNKHLRLCFLDFSKAFDRISHNVLIRKLVDVGVRLCLILLTGWGSFHQRNNSFREHNTLFSEHMRPSSYNTTRPTRNTADPYFTMTELSPINILPFKENY